MKNTYVEIPLADFPNMAILSLIFENEVFKYVFGVNYRKS